MSHFTVMVVGDVEYQLAPFHEFECTGYDDEFVTERDETDDARVTWQNANLKAKEKGEEPESWKKFCEDWYGYAAVDATDEPDLKGVHKYGYLRCDAQGEVAAVINRTNENAKWDWYREGGRWTGFLNLKGGGKANGALKRDIDWDGMRREAGEQAGETYDQMQKARNELTWEVWEPLRERLLAEGLEINEIREFYNAQPGRKAFAEALLADKELKDMAWFGNLDEFLMTSREDYIRRAENSRCATYAYVENRQWAQKGEMGWWGMSSDEMSEDDWQAQLWAKINALPDDARITIVDCHI